MAILLQSTARAMGGMQRRETEPSSAGGSPHTATGIQGDRVVTDHFSLLYPLSSNEDDLCPFCALACFFTSVPKMTPSLCQQLRVLLQILCLSCPDDLPLVSVPCHCITLCPAFAEFQDITCANYCPQPLPRSTPSPVPPVN